MTLTRTLCRSSRGTEGEGRVRTISEIIDACQEQQPATEEELRLTLLALHYCLQMSCPSQFASFGESRLRTEAEENFKRWFRLLRESPDKYLGANWTPGTPENTEQRRLSKRVLRAFEKARGG